MLRAIVHRACGKAVLVGCACSETGTVPGCVQRGSVVEHKILKT